MIYRALAVAVCWCAIAFVSTAAELKIVGPDSVPVGGTAFFKLEGAKAGDPFDYFSATSNLVVLFDIETTPIGVVTGERAGTVTLVAVKYDAESKKIQRVLRLVPIGTVPPTPVPPTPVPPGPTPPTPVPPGPVVEGKRSLLIIRESADTTPAMARMITALRNPPHADYLRSKGHRLAILDDDSVDQDGKPTPSVEAWRAHFKDLALPVLFVIDQASSNQLHKQSLAPTATAADVIDLLKKFGG